MVKTIGNPLSWTAEALSGTGNHLADATSRIVGSRSAAPPVIRTLTMEDIRISLRAGVDDFLALRSDVVFIAVLYPIIGLVMATFAFNGDLAHHIFPLASGFALIGPIGAIGLYELSRRRELGLDPKWSDAFALLRSPALGPILALGAILLAIFVVWMLAAHLVFVLTMGDMLRINAMDFTTQVLTTPGGWAMVLIGIPVGFVFAAIVLTISVVSFPLLLDRDVGVRVAVMTSVNLTRRNPRVIGAWGVVVATGLLIGSLPLFLGLIIVMPILGHATWHLYRRAIG
ncbi:DUF2189 domain-containing protein [Pseudoruegeria sp. SK021]|uniref:DUF2189 domain-containing protein n=1 Tax=Pseudoruegeria sp. SK021 TaxID=1933035 RepID=UPI000A255A17|nr:DUF2189 domain-containing protein [Pseudoruegeria sp. SK021]OSP55039.1 hypothetical protein BV911_09425 [Pseudoruegeria sp. SK021]